MGIIITCAISSQPRAEETMCLAKNIYYESRGEPQAGQVLVGQVTMNRVVDSNFPATICEVVYQPYQFSWTLDSNRQVTDGAAWIRSYAIAQRIILGNVKINQALSKANHFHTVEIDEPDWVKELTYLGTVGRHKFYGWK